MIDPRPLLTIPQAAKRRGLSRERIHQFIRSGRLIPVTIAGKQFVKVHDLDALTPLKPGRKTKCLKTEN